MVDYVSHEIKMPKTTRIFGVRKSHISGKQKISGTPRGLFIWNERHFPLVRRLI